MRLPGHRSFQLGILVAMLVPVIQLTLNGVDLLLLIRERFASVVNEYWLSPVSRQVCLGLRNLTIEIQTSLLQLLRRPFAERRIGRRIRPRSGRFRADWLPIARCALAVGRADNKPGDQNCE